jgi:hypothetical protein
MEDARMLSIAGALKEQRSAGEIIDNVVSGAVKIVG